MRESGNINLVNYAIINPFRQLLVEYLRNDEMQNKTMING